MWRTRLATLADLEAVLALRAELWSDTPIDEHRREIEAITGGRPPSTMPLAIFVAEGTAAVDAAIVGICEVGLRSHADGCDPTQPCGYLEGWFVRPDSRGQGVGRALVRAAEQWAADQGCVELASDTWLDNVDSQQAHAALGFEVVDRCVNYRKDLQR